MSNINLVKLNITYKCHDCGMVMRKSDKTFLMNFINNDIIQVKCEECGSLISLKNIADATSGCLLNEPPKKLNEEKIKDHLEKAQLLRKYKVPKGIIKDVLGCKDAIMCMIN